VSGPEARKVNDIKGAGVLANDKSHQQPQPIRPDEFSADRHLLGEKSNQQKPEKKRGDEVAYLS
jgi:hypothetical protein